ncbi:MAG: biotin--[acetyl-CoA-carboxylase] ligase [Phycisphaeraceae bacterium]|nr:biotin--[acetyl-CoA-carboxylase] ligase [Phycisphaeraceae bacterium]
MSTLPPDHDPGPLDLPAFDRLLNGQPIANRSDIMEQLERHKCRIESANDKVHLREAGLPTWADYLHWRFDDDRPVEVYQTVASTQDAARRLLESHAAPDRAVVAADHQTAGRGRLGRRWIAPAGTALLWTRVHDTQRNPVARLALAACVGVAEAIEQCSPGLTVSIKWPNDLYVDSAKLAGILTETVTHNDRRWALVGTGLNVSLPADRRPEALADATSLAILGHNVDRLKLLTAAVENVDRALDQPVETLTDAWRSRSRLLGRRVTVESTDESVTGEVVDLDPERGLSLRRPDGTLTIVSPVGATVRSLDDG